MLLATCIIATELENLAKTYTAQTFLRRVKFLHPIRKLSSNVKRRAVLKRKVTTSKELRSSSSNPFFQAGVCFVQYSQPVLEKRVSEMRRNDMEQHVQSFQ